VSSCRILAANQRDTSPDVIVSEQGIDELVWALRLTPKEIQIVEVAAK